MHPRIRAVQAALLKSRAATERARDEAADLVTPDNHAATDRSTDRIASRLRSSKRGDIAAATTNSSAIGVKPAWRPILYAVQPYEDNYVDDSFLSSLVTNGSE